MRRENLPCGFAQSALLVAHPSGKLGASLHRRSTTLAADDKAVALTNALMQIERQFGKGSIMKMGYFQDKMAFEVIPTGSIALDLALGVGGLPRGRIVEIYGPESSGKTTLALHAIAEAQRMGGTAAFIDVEHALDPNYAQ